MATYRNIQLSFWTDAKVADEFTPEDKYFYLYLLTNPHTNICGCYELSIRQMSIETGYSQETVTRLLERFALVHDVIRYSKANKELLVINWHKYNWTKSDKLKASIRNTIKIIKTQSFKDYLSKCYESFVNDAEIEPMMEEQEVWENAEPEEEPIVKEVTKEKKPEPVRHKFGEYKHVMLTDEQYARLIRDYGEEEALKGIKKVDEYCQQHGRTYVDYNLTIRKWGVENPKAKNRAAPDNGQVRRTLQ